MESKHSISSTPSCVDQTFCIFPSMPSIYSLATSLYQRVLGRQAGPPEHSAAVQHSYTPLTLEILQKRIQMAQELLEHSDVDACDENGLTVLMLALIAKDIEKVYALIMAGVDIEAHALPSLSGCTPLILAAAMGIAEQVEVLIKAGANIETGDDKGWTPLISAAVTGKIDTLKVLIKARANLEARDKQRNTALNWAIFHDRNDAVQILISAGAHTGIQNAENQTLLMLAAAEGKKDVVKMLIEAKVSLESRDKKDLTALVWAIIKNKIDIVRMLIEEGAHIESGAVLAWAIRKSGVDMIRLLMEARADIESPDCEGYMPLMNAVIQDPEKLDVIELLIQAGAKLEVQGQNGRTALMHAASQGGSETMKMLIAAGAKSDVKDHEGYTALALWMERDENIRNEAIGKLLPHDGPYYHYARQFLGRTFLAHAWGIKGTYQLKDPSDKSLVTFKLEGMRAVYAMKMLSNHVQHFFKTFNLDHKISKEHQIEICAVLAKAYPLVQESSSEVLSQLDAGKPIVILGGSESHGISMVLCKKQNKQELIICNRATGGRTDHTTQYCCFSQDITEEVIKDLRHVYEDSTAFVKMVQNLKISSIRSFRQKHQKMGNCGWTSAKGAFLILCRLYVDEYLAKKIYKQFTTFSREKALIEYLEEPGEPDFALLKKVRSKYVNDKPKLVLSDEAIRKLDDRLKVLAG